MHIYNACRLAREAQEKGSFTAYAIIPAFEETDVVVNDGYCTNGHATFFRLSPFTMFALRLSVVRLKGGMFLVKEAINDLHR